MRYKITNDLRKLIKKNKRLILNKDKDLLYDLKNCIYSNKTINKNQLIRICNLLNIEQPKLKVYYFNQKKNLGKYAITYKIKFDGKSKEFAEFVGVMLGDGSMNGNQIEIVIDKRDIKLKEHIKTLFKKLFSIELCEYESKTQNAVKLHKHNKELANLLIKYGLKRGDKIVNQVRIPDWIKSNNSYIISCLRGLILTDGCVYYSKRDKQTYAKFTNRCSNLLNDFQETAKILGFDFVKANQYNKALYKKDQVARFINTLNLSELKGL